MLNYNNTNPILIDCYTEEYHNNFHLQVPADQCACLLFPDGSRKFYGYGDHLIRLNRYRTLFRGQDYITQYRFDMSAQIGLSMDDIVSVPELMMRYIAPELKLYTSVDVRVNTEVSVRISDRRRLLSLLFSCQEEDPEAVLDAAYLTDFLSDKLHYTLTESLCRQKRITDTDLCQLSLLSDAVEVDLIEELCTLLDACGLELVSLHIPQIIPTAAGMEAFHQQEEEMMNRYNQATMEAITHPARKSSSRKKKKAADALSASIDALNLPPIFSGNAAVPAFA